MKRLGMMLVILALLLGISVGALAVGNGETTYRALLIGIDAYQTNALTGCVNDTTRVAAMLQAANEAGAFYQSPIMRSNLQKSEILSVFAELEGANVDEDDVTFFYFAGHGYLTDKETPGIVGKDNQMVSIAELLEQLDQLPGVKVVVFDTRYADSHLTKLSKEDGTMTTQLTLYNEAILNAFKQSVQPSNYYVLAASTLSSSVEAVQAAGQDAHGLMTYYLAEGCGYDYDEQRPTDALPADVNSNGAVSMNEILGYIESSILRRQDATDLVYNVQISPPNSAFPLLARRATAEVLEVKLEEGPIEVPVGRTKELNVTTQPVNASKHTIYWTSSDLSVATVNDDGVVSGVKPGTAQIAVTTSNGLTVATEVEVKDIKLIDSLTLAVSRLAIGEGTSTKLNLTIQPVDASEPVEWISDDPAVATVDEEGNVQCVGIGETFITVKADSGAEATCSLQVVDKAQVVTAIEVNKKAIEISEGESRNVQTKIKPKDAADPIVQFTSSDPQVAEISGESIITGIKQGTCIVYATASSGVSAEIKVTVKGAKVTLSKSSMLMKAGATNEIKVQVKPATLATPVKWESTDPSVATVEDGKVTAVADGVCAIVASLETGASATCRVMVGGTPVKNVKVKPAKAQMEVGGKTELTVEIRPENASLESLVWKSSDENVVQVDDTGIMTAVGAGRAIVTVTTMGGRKARSMVTVKGATASGMTVEPSSATLVAGVQGENQLTLSIDTPVTAGAVTVQYQSSNPKVATVNKEGVVTARSAGKTVIRAKSGKATADCNITVVANRAQNKKPIVGDEEKVYTSARQIGYKSGHLVVQLYYANNTKSRATVPEAGTIYLTLADGTSLPFTEVKAGKQKLAAGKHGSVTYKVKVKEGDALYGLNLRGASAELFAPGEAPLGAVSTLPATPGDDAPPEDDVLDDPADMLGDEPDGLDADGLDGLDPDAE